MKSTKVSFKVSLGQAEKDAGQSDEVSMVVSFVGVDEVDIRKAALASQVIKWQGQIRNNPDKVNEVPKVMTFGQPLFAPKARVVKAPVTEKDVQDFLAAKIAKMNQEQILEFARTGKLPEGI